MNRLFLYYAGTILLIIVFALACENPLKLEPPEWECTTTYTITPLNDENRILITRSATAIAETRFSAELQSENQALAKLCDSLTFSSENDRADCKRKAFVRYSIPGVDYTGLTSTSAKQSCKTR